MDSNQQEITGTNNTDTIFTEEDFISQGYDKHIRQARNAIYAAAIFLMLNVIVLVATLSDSYEYLWIDLLLWGVFIAGFILLGLWTKKKPYYAIISALILYGIFIAINAVLDISTLWKGILFKIGIIVYLIKGVSDAKEAQEMKDQIGK
jgi:hypothetical protein